MKLENTDDYSFRFKSQNDVLSDMVDTFMSTNDSINDFTVGSVSRSLLESVSVELEQLYYLTLENRQKMIDISVPQAFGFEAKDATYAYGTVTLRFISPTATNVYIPQGARFYSSDGNYSQEYRTNNAYIVPTGTSIYQLTVYCTEKGTVGNIPSGVIDSCYDISGLASITNTQAFNTGKDAESTKEIGERFRRMIASLEHGTRNSIEYAVNNIEGIESCYLYETNNGVVIIYAGDANGDLSDDLRQKVVDVASLYKPAGIRVVVRPVHKTFVNLDLLVEVGSDLLLDKGTEDYIKNNIEQYINSLGIGDYLYKDDIMQKVMDLEDNAILDCNVTPYLSIDEQLASDDYVSEDSPVYVGNTEVNQDQLKDPNIYQQATYGMIGLPNHDIKSMQGTSWNTLIQDNLVLNAGFHKDLVEDWKTNLGGHDIININPDLMYGNSNSIEFNIEDNGQNTYRYIESNRIPTNENEHYSYRAELKANGLRDKGYAVMMMYHNYDKEKDLAPVPYRYNGTNYNLLKGTQEKQQLVVPKAHYGYFNTVNNGGEQPYILPEPNLQNGVDYTYSMNITNLPLDSYLDVIVTNNDKHSSLEFKSSVYKKGFSGNASVTFSVPQSFGAVNSISLYLRTVNDMGAKPNIPYVRLDSEKLEVGGKVTAWYLSQDEIQGKPVYAFSGTSVTGTNDDWVETAQENLEIPKGINEISLRFYVQSYGVMYVAQPQVNRSEQLAPFKVSPLDHTPQFELPYTEYFELKSPVYHTAPNEIIRASNITVRTIDRNTWESE